MNILLDNIKLVIESEELAGNVANVGRWAGGALLGSGVGMVAGQSKSKDDIIKHKKEIEKLKGNIKTQNVYLKGMRAGSGANPTKIFMRKGK